MGQFLRTPREQRVIVEIPFSVPHDAQFEVMLTNEAQDGGYVNIYQDGHLVVAIQRDGKIQIGATLP